MTSRFWPSPLAEMISNIAEMVVSGGWGEEVRKMGNYSCLLAMLFLKVYETFRCNLFSSFRIPKLP